MCRLCCWQTPPETALLPRWTRAITKGKDRDRELREEFVMTAWSAGNGQLHQVQLTDVSDTLDCMHDQKMVLMEGNEMQQERKYMLRRLTPTECLRLQGLPDWWCDGANGSDTAIYKMAGNGLAIPCAADVLGRIAEAMEDGK